MYSNKSLNHLITVSALIGACAVSATAHANGAPVCEHDTSVTERFLPVELLTGLPFDDTQKELVFAPVNRVYPFVDILPDGSLGQGDTKLEGPVKWTGYNNVEYEVYERQVPRAHERFALTSDKTAIGRVYDARSGMIVNEGKFPVGLWKQGQKRSYSTLYVSPLGNRDATSYLEIEKLSCTYEGIPGAMQFGWSTSRGLEYGYIYVPGRGLAQVMTRKAGR